MSAAANRIVSAGEVYACSGAAHVTRHRVAWPELGAFSHAIKSLEHELGDEAHEEYWGSFIRPLRRYIFLISSTPLVTNDSAVYAPGIIERLDNHLRCANLLYPSFAGKARGILANFAAIVNRGGNPLLEELEKIFEVQSEGTAALVLKETKFTAEVEQALIQASALEGVEVMGTHHLRGDNCYDKIIILGAPTWYPEYLFSAARAREIYIVSYAWLRSTWKPEAAFLTTHLGGEYQSSASMVLRHDVRGEEVDTGALLSAEDLLPQVDLDAISERLARRYEGGHEYELVDANLLSLEGGAAVFIDASDKAKVLTIDPEGDAGPRSRGGTSRLRRVPVSYVEPGTYILLRTSGGGDYIIPLANKILGSNADYIRDCQAHWKGLLREEIASKGLFRVSYDLLELGSVRAEESNVRNWASSRNIRPEDERDFAAIMKLTGIEDKTTEYWRNAKALANAHLRAGGRIRMMLLKEVATGDLDELERTGRMNFELPGEDAGSLTAFRVLSVSEKKYKVPLSNLEDPFESEADLWLE
jgi:hypothetical protein